MGVQLVLLTLNSSDTSTATPTAVQATVWSSSSREPKGRLLSHTQLAPGTRLIMNINLYISNWSEDEYVGAHPGCLS